MPVSTTTESLPAEPEEHTFLDAGLTSRILYLQSANWFPGTEGALPEHTSRASKLLKEVEVDAGLSINPAEQVKLNKLMRQDVTVGMESKLRMDRHGSVSQRLKKLREERSKTAGRKWYDLARPEMTDEMRQELTVLRLMKYAKPGLRRGGAGARAGEAEHFEIGNVVAPASAHYTDRQTSSADGSVRKSAKLGFVDALLQDQDYKRFAKRKRAENFDRQQSHQRRPPPKMRR